MRKRWLIAGLLLALAGVLLRTVYTPMRFSGALLLCGAALSLVWGALEGLRERRWARLCRRVIAAAIIIGLAVFALLEGQVLLSSRTDAEREPEAVVILGAGVNGTTPSLSLQVRLDAAISYLADKPDIPIVVSGGQGPGEEISEAECMYRYLTAHGVSGGRICLEDRSTTTAENAAYSKEILAELGVAPGDGVAVVSADYHLFRAELYWDDPGFIGVAARMPGRYWPLTVNYYIREAFAAGYLLVFER